MLTIEEVKAELAELDAAEAENDAVSIEDIHNATPEQWALEAASDERRDKARAVFSDLHARLAISLHKRLAAAEAPQAEVWVHADGDTTLMAVRGRFTEQDIMELNTDLRENPPGELADGLYLVSVEWPRWEDGDTRYATLNWDGAAFQPLAPEVAR